MTNTEFRELWDRFQQTGKSLDDLTEDTLFVAASSHAHGADFHTVGFRVLDSLAAMMEEAIAEDEDEPTQAEIERELNIDADRAGIR